MEILEIAIVGTVLSGVVEFIKNKYGTKGWATKSIVVGFSFLLGIGIYFLSGTPAWAAFLGILGTASTIYSFILK